MGIRSRFVAVAAGYVVFLPLASRVHAGVATLELSAGGADLIVVSPGEAFSIDVILNAPEGMVHNSSLFSLVFTQAGLSYEGYSWAEPYENQTNFDFSSPLWSDLPLLIGPGLNPGPTSEVVLSNVVRSGEFSSGLLVSLSLRVPDDWTEMTNIGIAAFPDTFANGFEVMPVAAGDGVLVIVVPSGGGVGLLACIGARYAGCRRRSARVDSKLSKQLLSPAHGVVGGAFTSANH